MKKLKSDKKLFENKLFISLFLIAFVLMTLVTNYYGTTDTGDYLDSAKFFAGKYSADVRNTHSYIYGWMNAPFVWLFENFISFKIVNLIRPCIIASFLKSFGFC